MTGVERGASDGVAAYEFPRSLNLRDLGGLSTRAGLVVVRGRFFRSADPVRCGSADVLGSIGLRSAIDLRTSAELAERDNEFTLRGCEHIHHPLFEMARANWIAPPDQTPQATATRYFEMLHDGAPALVKIVTELAHRASDPFVIHCAAGRDRTGIVVACLLDLLDVTDDGIAADYAASDAFVQDGGRAHTRTMLEFLALVRARYGSTRELLRGQGVPDAAFDGLTGALLRRNPDDSSCIAISAELVSSLVARQFPEWSTRVVRAVTPGGWDNRTFRLGEDMLVRLPSHARYVAQVEKEQRFLPLLARSLPLPIPSPVAMGTPDLGYPWPWSVYRWIEGEPATRENIANVAGFARDLANFLLALQRVDTAGGPPPGEHNFFRGGSVATYDHEVREALRALGDRIDTAAASAVWHAALASPGSAPSVWVHGDIAAGNLLVQSGRLAAVIDFGSCAVGDPACDLTIAWTLLSGTGRDAFRRVMGMDDATWARARGWALWKALIVAHGDSAAAPDAWRVLGELLADPG
jgi:aminoglycoside phosphotransferase (APT) family kinase protein